MLSNYYILLNLRELDQDTQIYFLHIIREELNFVHIVI